jgi:acetyl-CoA carboxylase biotin carboxyl carrier protein
MNLDDIREVLELVREHDLAELEIERDGLKVRVKKAGHPVAIMPPAVPVVPVAVPAPTGPTTAATGPTAASGAAPIDGDGVDLAVIKSPIVGTFYRSPDPSAKAFVEVGDTIRKGQVLCIIEAMKLMNEIESDCDGEVAAVYVDNGRPVQFGERLFAVKVR